MQHVSGSATYTDDIPELANHYLQAATADGLPTKVLSPEAMARLKQHRWPGNVRELVNLVRRLSALSSEEVIGVETIEAELADAMAALEQSPAPADVAAEISLAPAPLSVTMAEKIRWLREWSRGRCVMAD